MRANEHNLKNKKEAGTPRSGRLFSENATCGDFTHTRRTDEVLRKNREIWFSTEGEKIREAIDRYYLFGGNIKKGGVVI